MAFIRKVSDVLDVASEHEEMDPVRGIQLLNEAHNYICSQNHLYPIENQSISLVSGQTEYNMWDVSPLVLKIWQCNYYTAPNAWNPVYPTNVDTLYQDFGPSWNLTTAGIPWGIYERGGNLGFYPTPNASTVGSNPGYPNVTIQYDYVPTLGTNDNMPEVATIYPWVYYMCQLQVMATDKPFAERAAAQSKYMELFEMAMKRLREDVYGRIAYDHPRVGIKIARVRRA